MIWGNRCKKDVNYKQGNGCPGRSPTYEWERGWCLGSSSTCVWVRGEYAIVSSKALTERLSGMAGSVTTWKTHPATSRSLSFFVRIWMNAKAGELAKLRQNSRAPEGTLSLTTAVGGESHQKNLLVDFILFFLYNMWQLSDSFIHPITISQGWFIHQAPC